MDTACLLALVPLFDEAPPDTSLLSKLWAADWFVRIVLPLMIAVGGFFLIEYVIRPFMRPKLVVEYGDDIHGCRVNVPDSYEHDSKKPQQAMFFRLKVQNKRRAVAKNVRAFLSNVELLKDGSTFVPTIYTDCLRLEWSYERQVEENRINPKTDGITLCKGHHDFVDICSTYINKHTADLGLLFYPDRYRPLLRGGTTFRLTIVIVADDTAPKTVRVTIAHDGI